MTGGHQLVLGVLAAEISPPHVVLGGKVMCPNWSSAAVRIKLRRDPLVLQLLQHRGEERPCRVQLVASDEEPSLAFDRVQ